MPARPSCASAALRDACLTLDHEKRSSRAVAEGLRRSSLSADPVTAAWIANLLGSGVLPVLYGFLGAIAAVVRSLSRKIRGSLLSPRDAQLSIQQLALGALIGACISLFIGGPASAANDPSLISRIFNIAPAGTVTRDEGRPPG
jgi:hypothetical protein